MTWKYGIRSINPGSDQRNLLSINILTDISWAPRPLKCIFRALKAGFKQPRLTQNGPIKSFFTSPVGYVPALTHPRFDCIDCTMASITIRRLPEPTKERLRIRAARSGLSLEAYTRQILQTASQVDMTEPLDLAELAQACFGPDDGIDLNLPPRGSNRPPLSFD